MIFASILSANFLTIDQLYVKTGFTLARICRRCTNQINTCAFWTACMAFAIIHIAALHVESRHTELARSQALHIEFGGGIPLSTGGEACVACIDSPFSKVQTATIDVMRTQLFECCIFHIWRLAAHNRLALLSIEWRKLTT